MSVSFPETSSSSLYLCANSEGSGETAHAQARLDVLCLPTLCDRCIFTWAGMCRPVSFLIL